MSKASSMIFKFCNLQFFVKQQLLPMDLCRIFLSKFREPSNLFGNQQLDLERQSFKNLSNLSISLKYFNFQVCFNFRKNNLLSQLSFDFFFFADPAETHSVFSVLLKQNRIFVLKLRKLSRR